MTTILNTTGVAHRHFNNIGSGRERTPGSRDDDNSNSVVIGCIEKGIGGRVIERFVERIERVGSVERDGPNAIDVGNFEHDVPLSARSFQAAA
ncbi:unannotated protein [freshwater metagenome]|uniref:Unannotated protein n=1 Tax=freshwater metagenome TaxID=449393 RepID=A0A6J7N0W5_9ZZZZ